MNVFLSLESHFTVLQFVELALRIIVACACGAAIGIERSRRLKEAGLRTHLIVCCAAALMMIVSKYGFADLVDSAGNAMLGTKGADPSRIAAQVICGVSFIGAGVIFHHDKSVKGLTTAAGLWATAGIGITIGAGMYGLGIFTTVLITVIQILLHRYAIGMDNITTMEVGFTVVNSGSFRDVLKDFLKKRNADVVGCRIDEREDGYSDYHLTIHVTEEIDVEELEYFLKENEDVTGVSCMVMNS